MTRPVVVTKAGFHVPAALAVMASTLMLASVIGLGCWAWEQVITPLLTVLIWLHVIVQP